MSTEKMSLDLTPQELTVIESALRTQEKILSVQSRAGGDSSASARLSELKQVLRTLSRQSGSDATRQCQGWGGVARGLFG